MSARQLFVECFGHPDAKSVRVNTRGTEVSFLFDDQKPQQSRYHLGLFVDYSATTGLNYLRYPKSRRVALLSEPNSSMPFVDNSTLCRRFSVILTHDARLINRGSPFVEFPFGTSFVSSVLKSQHQFDKSRLLSMIGAPHPNPKAGHVLRNQVIDALRHRHDVDCFGRGVQWIDSKLEGLSDYAFSIAIENCNRDFYFTEKIIDCFLTDTVPIYWGCPGIERYFDRRGMLVFDDLSELDQIISGLNYEKYSEMLPFVRQNRDLAISQKWATRPQLFERVGRELLCRLGNSVGYVSPTIFAIAQNVRRALSAFTNINRNDRP